MFAMFVFQNDREFLACLNTPQKVHPNEAVSKIFFRGRENIQFDVEKSCFKMKANVRKIGVEKRKSKW